MPYSDMCHRSSSGSFEISTVFNDISFCQQNTILPEAVQFWEQALMVRETKEIIRLNRYD